MKHDVTGVPALCAITAILCSVGCSRESGSAAEKNACPVRAAYVRKDLSAEQNAYPLWTNAMAYVKQPHESFRMNALFSHVCSFKTNMPECADGQALAEWMGEKREMFELIPRALAVGHLQFPLEKQGNSLEPLSTSGWVKLASWMVVAGRGHEQKGEFALAVRQYRDVSLLGGQMMAGQGPGLMYLVGNGLSMRGLTAVRRLCGQDEVESDVLREALRAMPVPVSTDANLAECYRVEAAFGARWFCSGFASAPLLTRFRLGRVFDRDETLKLTDALYAHYITNALCTVWRGGDTTFVDRIKRRAAVEGLPEGADGVTGAWSQWLLLVKAARGRPNIYGERLVALSADVAASMLLHSFRARAMTSLTRTFVALRIVKKEAGAYPESLEAAVAKGVLSEVPMDFFSDKPVRYSLEKRKLWSVGPDGVDNGGDAKMDLVLTLPE